MANYKSIISDHATLLHHAGKTTKGQPEAVQGDDAKRNSLISALTIRKDECNFRFKIAAGILIVALVALVCIALISPKRLGVVKEIISILGGGSILALVYYIISLRDEMTKIKQTIIIATTMDGASLGAMLLALSAK